MMVPAAQWMKDALARNISDAFALEELAHRGIIADTHDIAGDFDLKMQIADHPAEPRGICSFPAGKGGALDLQHRFILLREDVGGRVTLKNDSAIGQRRFEVETEIMSVFCDSTPAAFGEHEAFDGNAQGRKRSVPIVECAVDEIHRQNRK